MLIYMEHPEHGRMPVYDTAQKQRVEQWGWKEVKEEIPVSEPIEHEPAATVRRGRKTKSQ